jgi:hypothetical protein
MGDCIDAKVDDVGYIEKVFSHIPKIVSANTKKVRAAAGATGHGGRAQARGRGASRPRGADAPAEAPSNVTWPDQVR